VVQRDKVGGFFLSFFLFGSFSFFFFLIFHGARGADFNGGCNMIEDLFQRKFGQMRETLLRVLRVAPSAQGFHPDRVLTAFASHLQEVSPKYGCPRWEVIRAAAGWSVFLKTFIADRQKLDDAIYKTDPDYIEAMAFLAQDRAKEKEEKARQKVRARRGFIYA